MDAKNYPPRTHREHVLKGLWELQRVLGPIAEGRMATSKYGPNWHGIAGKKLHRSVGPTFCRNPENVIKLVDRFYDDVFEELLGAECRGPISYLKAARNDATHEANLDVVTALHMHDCLLKIFDRLGHNVPDIRARRDALKEDLAEETAARRSSNGADSQARPDNVREQPRRSQGLSRKQNLGIAAAAIAVVATMMIVRSLANRNAPTPAKSTTESSAQNAKPQPQATGRPAGDDGPLRSATGSGTDQRKTKPQKPDEERSSTERNAQFLNLIAQKVPLVLVVDAATHRVDVDVTDRIATALHGEGGAFTPAFVSDGLFAKAFQGDAAALRQLKLPDVPMIVLGIKESIVTNDPSIDPDYKKGATRLTVRVYRPSKGFTSSSFVVDGIGPGFVPTDAARAADGAAVEKMLARLNENP